MPQEIEKDLLEADERQSKDRRVPKLPLQQLLLGFWYFVSIVHCVFVLLSDVVGVVDGCRT